MRNLAFTLLVAAALPVLAVSYGNIVVRDGDNHYTIGYTSDPSERTGLGDQYASFVRDGVRYVIQDGETLARIRRILKPQADLGQQQAALGSQQADLGAQQAALGARQAALGMEQTTASSARAHDLSRQQNALSRQQQKLSEQQAPLAAKQRILGDKQREAARIARGQLEKVFEEAVRSGSAKRQ